MLLASGLQRPTLIPLEGKCSTSAYVDESACVMLAWSALIILVAVGMKGPDRQAQANIRIASSTTQITLASSVSAAAAHATAPRPTTKYLVQPGDTLSGIAARFAVRGGWPGCTRPTGRSSALIQTSSSLASF